MFHRTPDGVYRSTLLDLPWLEHGFSTKQANGWPGEYTFLKQIHSDRVVTADEGEGCMGQGDALVTNTPDRWVGVRTADCVPLLMADVRRRAVASVHAGWKGTAAKIASRAVRVLTEQYGSEPKDLRVAIGPCIANCCFEVGPEVAAQFSVLTRTVDLVAINLRQLEEAGVPADSIDFSGLCTKCSEREFHSYRRDKELAGRMVAAIRIM